MGHIKIFVYGTLQGIDEPASSELVAYCRRLGLVIANAGHTIIAVSNVAHVVDGYYLEGMASTSAGGCAIVCKSNDPAYPFEDDRYANIKFTFISNPGQLNNAHIAALHLADVVLVVAGTHALDPEIGYQAVILDKPILALPDFGHAAKRIWETVFPAYREKHLLEDDEIGDIGREKIHSAPQRVVETLENLVARHRNSISGGVSPVTIFITTLLCATLWIAAFTSPLAIGLEYLAAFFGTIVTASLLGILLRFLTKMASGDTLSVSKSKLATEGAIGLILALVFSLVWIVNNFVVTGKELDFGDRAEFSRVSIVCSLLALTVSYYFESSLEKFRNLGS